MAEALGEIPLLNYLDRLVDALRRLAPRAVEGKDSDSVHDARVASRRLKAAIDLVNPIVSRRHLSPVVKINRTLRRRLGPLRDLDVMIEHLAHLRSPSLEPARTWLIQRLKKRRQKTVARAAADLPPARVLARLGNWWGVRQEISTSGKAVDSLLAESIHLQVDDFTKQAEQWIANPQATDAHALRIAGKSLRYTLEMAKSNGAHLPPPVLQSFRRVQTSLGLWHDFVMLTEFSLSESAAQQLATHDAARQQLVLKLSSAMLRRSQMQLDKVAEFWRTGGAALMEAITSSFPLTAPAAVPEPEVPPQEMKPEETTGEQPGLRIA